MACMRTYLALLTVYESNSRTLHWLLSGDGWHTAHERYAGYYEELGEFMDQTAEQLLSMGMQPVNDAEALELVKASNIDAFLLSTDKAYSVATADEAAYRMFKQLHDFALELADDDDNYPDDVCDVFMDQARWFRIEGLYKLGRATRVVDSFQNEKPPVAEVPPAAQHLPEQTPEVTVIETESTPEEDMAAADAAIAEEEDEEEDDD